MWIRRTSFALRGPSSLRASGSLRAPGSLKAPDWLRAPTPTSLRALAALTLAIVAVGFGFVSVARAGDSSAYERLCASCHGPSGRADTGVGRALKIPSFEGASFTRAQIEKLLRESKSHSGIAAKLAEGELDRLVETLNALAAGD